jgi:uncharacterized protein YbjT (DUF2867 family)
MKAPEITPEARSEIAAALAVLRKHKVSAARASDPDWSKDHQGWWVVPVGSECDHTQAFRPFWIGNNISF